MDEAIRLVIWDLDETFWEGTVSEGGVKKYSQSNHELVISLAHRGIVSSICSKNDYDEVRSILIEKNIWEFFIFPSINWFPKAERISDIIRKTNLRPASVLFIDDNHGNLAEVKALVPLINVADQSAISSIPSNKFFVGKNDSNLTRLSQYKVLEKKFADQPKTSGDNIAFLRNSDIRISVNHDIESNLDRAVELINRTNQLNFTKIRLSEDSDLAKSTLLKMITDIPYARTAGLVKVTDAYGDYGYVGFYLCEQFHTDRRLIHFCFSCRTLGMGIEKWMYDKLGRPTLTLQGDMHRDLEKEKIVDWITFDSEPELVRAASTVSRVPQIFLRGGCDLDSVAHYLRYHCDLLVSETNFIRDGQFIRKDSLVNLWTGTQDFTKAKLKALDELGFGEQDFQSHFVNNARPGDVVILSLWAELMLHSYKHKHDELHILMQLRPLSLNYAANQPEDLSRALHDAGLTPAQSDVFVNRCNIIKDKYNSDFFDAPLLKAYFFEILNRIPDGVRIIILLPSEKFRNDDKKVTISKTHVQARLDIQKIANEREHVRTVDIMESIAHDSEYVDVAHFSRMVYYRIYRQILDAIESD